LVHEGHFYCVTDKGLAVCLEAATGSVKYQERLDIKGAESRSKPVYASLVLADGHLYAVTRKAGVFVYAVGTSFSKPSVMKLGEGEDFSATPAISGNSMFLRSDTALYCVRH
jgi:outer membrane protein assembly factor BamB